MKKFSSIFAVIIFGLLICVSANATTLTITKTADTSDGVCDADCSLREAVTAAMSGDAIIFDIPAGDTNCLSGVCTVKLTAGELYIGKNLTISGVNARNLIISGENLSRVFSIALGFEVSMARLTVQFGRTGVGGGGILNFGTLTLSEVAVNDCAAASGGGIANGGTLRVFSSTVSGNRAELGATGIGGGISNGGGGTISVYQSTVSNNYASESGGAIANLGGTVTLNFSTVTANSAGNGISGITNAAGAIFNVANSIIAGNIDAGNATLDIGGAFASQGYNFIGSTTLGTGFTATGDQTGTSAVPLNPQLGALADNGGQTDTHSLSCTSAARNAANPNLLTDADQRGTPRPLNGRSDGGAFEARCDVITVTNNNSDSSVGSLRWAIANAPVNGVIVFDQNLSGATILTGGTDFVINRDITIDGSTVPLAVNLSGGNSSRVLLVTNNTACFLHNLNITGGAAVGAAGGGISSTGRMLFLNRVSIYNNRASDGGGISMPTINFASEIFLINSTVSGNTANRRGGGGIYCSQPLTVINSTITNNFYLRSSGVSPSSNSGGIQFTSFADSLYLHNSIVTDNFSPTVSDISTHFVLPQGINFIGHSIGNGFRQEDVRGVSAQLAPLARAANGLMVHLPLSTSPVMNHLTPPTAPVAILRDATGAARPSFGRVDIGAVESNGFLTLTPATLPTPTVNQFYSQTLTATGGNAPYNFVLVGGGLPVGLSLDSATGIISGTTQQGGNFNFTVRVFDSAGRLQTQSYSFTINHVVANTAGDSSVGSFRWAIANSASGGTITLAPGLSGQTINTAGLHWTIDRNLTIDGSMLAVPVTLDGGNTSRVLDVSPGITFSLSNVNITGGNAGPYGGGGLYNRGTSILRNVSIYNNRVTSGGGGGIYNGQSYALPVLTLINCTVSGNFSGQSGAGIYNHYSVLTLINTTVSNNQAFSPTGISITSNGGITNNVADGGQNQLTIKNSIIAGNAANIAPEIGSGYSSTTVNSQGYNLIGSAADSTGWQATDILNVAANLAPLGNYGGGLMTQATIPGSSAIDKGAAHTGITTDQRGAARPVDNSSVPNAPTGNASDIGAFENYVTIAAATFPNGMTTVPYTPVNLSASRIGAGTPNFQFSIVPTTGEDLPPGLTLSPAGTISGTPTTSGGFYFTVRAADQTDDIAGARRFFIAIDQLSTISGRVNFGAPLSGVTVNLTGATTATTQTDANGDYSFPSILNGNYTVTPQLAGYRFTPVSRAVIVNGANQTGQNFVANCGFDLSSSAQNFTGANGIGAFGVAAGTGCSWTATSNAAWLTVTGGANGNGSGTVSFNVAVNLGASRTATITVGAGANTMTFTVSQAGTNAVTNANRSGTGSLRQALADATDGTLIVFDPAFFNIPRTIDLNPNGDQHNELQITRAVTIQGPGANLLTISGNNGSRVFSIAPSLSLVTIKDLTITQGGNVPNGGGIFASSRLDLINVVLTGNAAGTSGGAIYNNYQRVDIIHSTVSNNTVVNANGLGGGIYVQNFGSQTPGTGQLNIVNSTFSGNSATTGGAVMNNLGTATRISNSTFSGNAAGIGGGSAIYQNAGNVLLLYNSTVTNNTGGVAVICPNGNGTIHNSIIAANTNDASGINGTHNLIGNGDTLGGTATIFNGVNGNIVGSGAILHDPRLKPLANNGGTTQTHALETDSAARDTGNNSLNLDLISGEALTLDQRGIARIINSTVDIGAVENYAVSLTQNVLPNGSLNTPYNFTLQATGGIAPYSYAVTEGNLPSGLILQANGQLAGTPTQSGLFEFTVTVTDSNPGSGFAPQATDGQFVQLQILAPTAANASISGRVSTADGRGIRNARVILTDSSGVSKTISTSTFGYYRFDDLQTGETYILQVVSKRFTFQNPSRIINLTEDLTDADFVTNSF